MNHTIGEQSSLTNAEQTPRMQRGPLLQYCLQSSYLTYQVLWAVQVSAAVFSSTNWRSSQHYERSLTMCMLRLTSKQLTHYFCVAHLQRNHMSTGLLLHTHLCIASSCLDLLKKVNGIA